MWTCVDASGESTLLGGESHAWQPRARAVSVLLNTWGCQWRGRRRRISERILALATLVNGGCTRIS